MCVLKKLTILLLAAIVKKDWKLLTELLSIHMMQVLEKYVKHKTELLSYLNIDVTNENKIENNSNQPHIPEHLDRILIRGASRSGPTNALLNLIKNWPDINKIYPYAKDPYEAKYKYLINKHIKAL